MDDGVKAEINQNVLTSIVRDEILSAILKLLYVNDVIDMKNLTKLLSNRWIFGEYRDANERMILERIQANLANAGLETCLKKLNLLEENGYLEESGDRKRWRSSKLGNYVGYWLWEYESQVDQDHIFLEINELLDLPSHPCILDAGCGGAQSLVGLAKIEPCLSVGLEFDWFNIIFAKVFVERYMGKYQSVNLLQGDIQCVPLPANTFDLVICRGVLTCVNNDVAIQEISRVLKTGGHLYLYYAGFGHWIIRFLRALRQGDFTLAPLYAIANGLNIYLSGKQLSFRDKYSAFQTKSGIERLLRKYQLQPTGYRIQESEHGLPEWFAITARKEAV